MAKRKPRKQKKQQNQCLLRAKRRQNMKRIRFNGTLYRLSLRILHWSLLETSPRPCAESARVSPQAHEALCRERKSLTTSARSLVQAAQEHRRSARIAQAARNLQHSESQSSDQLRSALLRQFKSATTAQALRRQCGSFAGNLLRSALYRQLKSITMV